MDALGRPSQRRPRLAFPPPIDRQTRISKHNHNSNGGDFAEGAETLPRNEHVGSFAEGAKRRCRTNISARSSRDLAPDLIVIAGFDGYFERVNPATERILGYSRRESLSRTFQGLFTLMTLNARSTSSPSW